MDKGLRVHGDEDCTQINSTYLVYSINGPLHLKFGHASADLNNFAYACDTTMQIKGHAYIIERIWIDRSLDQSFSKHAVRPYKFRCLEISLHAIYIVAPGFRLRSAATCPTLFFVQINGPERT